MTSLLLGCAPAASRSGEVAGHDPAASAPAGQAAEKEAFQQWIVDTHGNLLSVLQKMALLDPERQRQIGGLMVEMLAEDAGLLAEFQPVVDAMTTEEREAAGLNRRRIAADIRDLGPIVSGTPTGGVGQWVTGLEDPPRMDALAQEMTDIHRRGLARLQEMNLPRLQGMAANVVDLAGNLKRLKDPLQAGFERLPPDQQTAIRQRLERMRALSEQVVRVAGA